MNEIKYPYKPKILTYLLVTLGFAVAGGILSKVALSNTQGVILNRFIEFSPNNATIFYWCLVGASAIFVAIGILGICSALTTKNEIVLTKTEFSVPKKLIGNNIVSVNFSDITHLAPITVHGQNMLIIQHKNGDVTIQQSAMPNKQAYDEVVKTITTKVQFLKE